MTHDPQLETLLRIDDLHAEIEDKAILCGVSLTIPRGQVHAIMGPNGSGKSTLANVLMGHPAYRVTGGRIVFKGQDITQMSPDERARLGMFLAFQYPVEVAGVSVLNFLRTSLKALRGEDVPARQFRATVQEALDRLEMDISFARRNLNEGFSGGEKKRNEVLQLTLLEPELAILDETDSGLDIDAIKLVSGAVAAMRSPRRSSLVITHYARILNFLQPDAVHILYQGRVVESGGRELADRLEAAGYDEVKRRFAGDTASAGAA